MSATPQPERAGCPARTASGEPAAVRADARAAAGERRQPGDRGRGRSRPGAVQDGDAGRGRRHGRVARVGPGAGGAAGAGSATTRSQRPEHRGPVADDHGGAARRAPPGSAASSAASVSASTPSVGSSSSSSGRSASSARASATRRCWPVDSPCAVARCTGVSERHVQRGGRGGRARPAGRSACGAPSRMLSATVPRDQHRALRHPGDPAQPRVAVDVGEVDAADRHRAPVRAGASRAAGRAAVDLPAPLGPVSPRTSPGGGRGRQPVEHRAAAPVHADRVQPHGGPAAGRAPARRRGPSARGRSPARRRRRRRRRAPSAAVVEPGADRAQRQVDLRGQHDDQQRRCARSSSPCDQPQPDRHRDERHRQRGQQLQRERGQERHPQRPHRRAPVVARSSRAMPPRPARGRGRRRRASSSPATTSRKWWPRHGERAPLPAVLAAGCAARRAP